jgi:RNA-dependent RNA polymerase
LISVFLTWFYLSIAELKESSLWLVHGRKSSAQVRALLGDFSNCQTASKWAARVGQCFSTTVDCKVAGFQITSPAVVPDIASLSGKEHSDGTGIVTRRLFDEMCKDLPFSSDPRDFSIVQIRFGGAKGTLSAWDNFEHFYHCHLQKTKKDVVLRNSMKKFNSPYERIEVCSVGTTVVS